MSPLASCESLLSFDPLLVAGIAAHSTARRQSAALLTRSGSRRTAQNEAIFQARKKQVSGWLVVSDPGEVAESPVSARDRG